MADTSNKLTDYLFVVKLKKKTFLLQNVRLDVYTLNPSHVVITDSVSCSVPLGIAMDHD